MSSSARSMIRASLRSIVHFEPLKSKRVPISRATPCTALSTSAISVLETMSKLGMGNHSGSCTDAPGSTAERARDPSVPEHQGQRTHHVEHVERYPDSVIAQEWRQNKTGRKAKNRRDDHAVADLGSARGAEINAVELEAPDRDQRGGGDPQEMIARDLQHIHVMAEVGQEKHAPFVERDADEEGAEQSPEAAGPHHAAEAVAVARADRLAGQAFGGLGEAVQPLRDEGDEAEQDVIGRQHHIAHLGAGAHKK